MTGETEPLLGSATKPAQHPKKLLISIVCAIFLLSADFGFFMSTAPKMAVYEDIICRNYQATLQGAGNGTLILPESNPCKSEAVQGELALVIGYQNTFDVVPGMCLLRYTEVRMLMLWKCRPYTLVAIWHPLGSLGAEASLVS
jgi:hypothetical protein